MVQRRMGALEWAMIALIMVVGVALRTIVIGRESLWGDEALTLMLAKLPLFDLFFRPVDPTAGLYYAVHKVLVPDHMGAAVARLPALIAGVLTIPAGYWLGRAALDRRAGYAVAALLAVSGPLIDYSQEARAYSLLVLLVTLSAAALIQAFPLAASPSRGPVRWSSLAIFVLTGILAVYTHFVGWLWLMPAMLLALLQIDQRSAATRVHLALLAAAVLAVVMPELNRLAGYALSSNNEFHWLVQADTATFFALLDTVFLPLSAEFAVRWFPVEVASVLIVVRNVALVTWIYLALRHNFSRLRAALRRRAVASWVILIFASIPLAGWLIGFLFTPMIMDRTALPALPGLFLVLAALAHLKGGWRVILMLVLVYAGSSVASGLSRPKEQWATAARIVAEQSTKRPLLLFCPTWRAAAFMTAAEQLRIGGSTMVVFKQGMARRVSIDLGRDPLWADRYVRLAMQPALPAYQSVLGPGRVVQLSGVPPEIIMVSSECPERERKAIKEWLGPGEERRVGQAPAVRGYPAIDISLFRPAGQKMRTLIVDPAS